MLCLMTRNRAIELARSHAAEWGVPWQEVLSSGTERGFLYLFVAWYSFTVDTGNGRAIAVIRASTRSLYRFEFYPNDPRGFLLPLWAAFPLFSSVTSGWRQGSGEPYKYRWHSFYRGLTLSEKEEYRKRFPPPDDRGWQGFYEFIADRPATGEHSIAECILGQVP